MRIAHFPWFIAAYFFLLLGSAGAGDFVDGQWQSISQQMRQSEQKGDFKSALALLDRFISDRARQYFPEDFVLAASLRQRARLRQLAGEKEDMAALWKAISIDADAFGRDNPIVAFDYVAIADVLAASNDLEEAQTYYMQAILIFRASFGPMHTITDATFKKLARVTGPVRFGEER